jgi:hypothetical protein
MKNQYFGDVRDLFKYDLIQWILEETSSLQRFTFIPMLTKNDNKRKEGNKRDFNSAKAGAKNKNLMEFLEKYKEIARDERDFTDIRNYFKSKGIEIVIYKEQKNKYFNHRTRAEYFNNMPEEFLHNSLVFIDPDIGLEIKNSTENHLLYSEVKYLYNRINGNSTLMIYQHFPRNEKHKEYLKKRSDELKDKTKDLPIYISDNQIIFFFLTKNKVLKESLGKIISNYGESYNLSDYNSG